MKNYRAMNTRVVGIPNSFVEIPKHKPGSKVEIPAVRKPLHPSLTSAMGAALGQTKWYSNVVQK
jgi:hypothetical protein